MDDGRGGMAAAERAPAVSGDSCHAEPDDFVRPGSRLQDEIDAAVRYAEDVRPSSFGKTAPRSRAGAALGDAGMISESPVDALPPRAVSAPLPIPHGGIRMRGGGSGRVSAAPPGLSLNVGGDPSFVPSLGSWTFKSASGPSPCVLAVAPDAPVAAEDAFLTELAGAISSPLVGPRAWSVGSGFGPSASPTTFYGGLSPTDSVAAPSPALRLERPAPKSGVAGLGPPSLGANRPRGVATVVEHPFAFAAAQLEAQRAAAGAAGDEADDDAEDAAPDSERDAAERCTSPSPTNGARYADGSPSGLSDIVRLSVEGDASSLPRGSPVGHDAGPTLLVQGIRQVNVMLETQGRFAPLPNYIEEVHHGRTMRAEWRHMLVEWIFDFMREFRQSQETVHLAINLMDRYLSVKIVNKADLQRLAVTCCFTASKVTTGDAINLGEMVSLFAGKFRRDDIKRLELQVTEALGWHLNSVMPFGFVQWLLQLVPSGVNGENRQSVQDATAMCLDLAALDHQFLAYSASSVAIASVLVAIMVRRRDLEMFTTALSATGVPMSVMDAQTCMGVMLRCFIENFPEAIDSLREAGEAAASLEKRSPAAAAAAAAAGRAAAEASGRAVGGAGAGAVGACDDGMPLAAAADDMADD